VKINGDIVIFLWAIFMLVFSAVEHVEIGIFFVLLAGLTGTNMIADDEKERRKHELGGKR
jgi:MFS-type transporter involved in bile tolerance (Atg22 family)